MYTYVHTLALHDALPICADMHPVGKRLLGLGRILDAPAIEGEAHAVISAFDAGAAQATHRQCCEAVRTTVLEQRWHALLAPDDDHGANAQDATRHPPPLAPGTPRPTTPTPTAPHR